MASPVGALAAALALFAVHPASSVLVGAEFHQALQSLSKHHPPKDGALPARGVALAQQPAVGSHFSVPVRFVDPKDPIYRPWAKRFDIKPYNVTSPYSGLPENRDGYRRFMEANPRHAVAPNSRDRDAESTVIVLFALAVLGTIAGAVLLTDKVQAMEPDKAVKALLVSAIVPWVLLALWILHVVTRHFWSPCRSSVADCRWQCDAILWYLAIAPTLTILNVMLQITAVVRTHAQDEVAMGRMFGRGVSKVSERGASGVPPTWLQITMLMLELGIAIFGVVIVFFSGRNRTFCEPEVWWTGAALATLTVIVFLAAIFAWIGALCTYSMLKVPLIRSMVNSFDVAMGGEGELDASSVLHPFQMLVHHGPAAAAQDPHAMAQLQQLAMQNPQAMAKLQQMMQDPEMRAQLQQAMGDPQVMAQMQQTQQAIGNPHSVAQMHHAMSDPQVNAQVQQLIATVMARMHPVFGQTHPASGVPKVGFVAAPPPPPPPPQHQIAGGRADPRLAQGQTGFTMQHMQAAPTWQPMRPA